MSDNSNLTSRPTKIIQFGGGNFLRGFIGWMVDILNQETDFNGNILVVKPTIKGDYSALRKQDGKYHTVLSGIKNGKLVEEVREINSINQIIHSYLEYDSFLQSAELKELKFVLSNTTESGIKFSASDLFSLSEVPKEFPAKLTIWLYQRFNFFDGSPESGLIFLPCELIEANGLELKGCIIQYAKNWGLSPEFILWIETHNIFCNTLVDRIISGYPDEWVQKNKSKLGFEDRQVVAGELYHSWIIQADDRVSNQLPFGQTDLNVKFTSDLDLHRIIKVRILNGAHTSMVPIGLLAGKDLVSEVMDDDGLEKFFIDLLFEEVIPTINHSKKELEEFALDTITRFKNTHIKHHLSSISLNSISKFGTRLLPTLLDYWKINKGLPSRIVLAMSALIYLYGGRWNEIRMGLKDNNELIQLFDSAWSLNDTDNTVSIIIKNKRIWKIPKSIQDQLCMEIIKNLDNIKNLGMEGALSYK